MIVTFSGMDGAGKTTQIELLVNRLRDEGYSAKKMWSRGGYTPGFVFLKNLLRIFMGKSVPPPGRSAERARVMSKSYMTRLWLALAMLDMTLLYGVVFRIQSLLGKIVVCDRYLDDTRLDFSLNFPHLRFEKMWLWKLLQWSAPNPDAAFLFLLPVNISLERSKMKNEPFPDDEETLAERLSTYSDNRFFPKNSYVLLDGCESVDAIRIVISDKIFELLK